MKILHLRGDRRFAETLRDVVEAEGHRLRWADCWDELFARLPAGPYGMAILYLPRPTPADEQQIRRLADEAGDATEIHLITADQQFALALREAHPGRFRWAPPDVDPRMIRQPIQQQADRLAHAAGAEPWEEIAPGIRLRRGVAYWTVERAGITESLTPQEAAVLDALLEAHGQPVAKAALARQAGRRHLLSESALYAVISHLREKLEDDPHQPRHLLTVQRSGYLWRR